MSLNDVGAPLCPVCVPWLAGLDRVCFGGACVHPSALGCVCVFGMTRPYSHGGVREQQEVEIRGCLHLTAEILILPCGLQIPLFTYRLSYPVCPMELIPGPTRL